jgi:transglutaminase-like putative cysteine protease
MIYDVFHLTTYTYDSPVALARCALRLLPKDEPGQIVLAAGLEISPAPATSVERRDFFGNRVVNLTIETAHRELRVEARSRVEVGRIDASPPRRSEPWEDVNAAVLKSQALAAQAPAHFIYSSRLVPLLDPVTDYARESFPAGGEIIESATDLMHRIRADFLYDPKATAVSTPLLEAFENRGGVCQDFAHIMIAGLRGLGLPAAYVSGYIRSVPAAGKPLLEGADASHAWVSLWCGPHHGWIGLDPTNGMMVADEHVVLAAGRDYDDISPIHGILLGPGEQEIDVAVHVIPWNGDRAGHLPAAVSA